MAGAWRAKSRGSNEAASVLSSKIIHLPKYLCFKKESLPLCEGALYADYMDIFNLFMKIDASISKISLGNALEIEGFYLVAGLRWVRA
ncbi:MAG: hypothetical protein AB7E05_09530 [Sphingobium sp.]